MTKILCKISKIKLGVYFSIPLIISCIAVYWLIISTSLAWDELSLVRSSANPIIHPLMKNLEGELGTNINGPSVILVPDWLENPLGRYYMYFAHHRGQYIRLAFADSPEGPWTVYKDGALHLDDTMAWGHIASPDVHVDTERHEIRMYFHGLENRQRTYVATSKNGIQFSANPTSLGPPYFRVFRYKDCYFAIAKKAHKGGGILMRSPDGLMPFEKGPKLIPKMRHAAVHVDGDVLTVFYTRIGDAPERIFRVAVKLQGNWRTWQLSEPVEILRPERDYEGIQLAIEESKTGIALLPVYQIRDPALLIVDEERYLYYSVAGEQGIGVASFVNLSK